MIHTHTHTYKRTHSPCGNQEETKTIDTKQQRKAHNAQKHEQQ